MDDETIIRNRNAALLVKLSMTGAHIGPSHPMCASCAFKAGTVANQDDIVNAAADCLANYGMFMCHEKDQICGGFQNAKNVFKDDHE